MGTPYNTALEDIIRAAKDAQQCRARRGADVYTECVPLDEAVGRVAAADLLSPLSTPEHDTSAMDGYAIRSTATTRASARQPVVFHIMGTIAAGDVPEFNTDKLEEGVEPCVELMTGARFPPITNGIDFDACVKAEDTQPVQDSKRPMSAGAYMMVTKPVLPNANRRPAGRDIAKGQAIVQAGELIQLSHILPLASVGIETVVVQKKLRLGIWSTGKELISGKSGVRDVNGPFLKAACRDMGIDARYLGTIDDKPGLLRRDIKLHADSAQFDLLITTGAVSVGKFDFVREAIEHVGGSVVFHGLAIRPGHPVLFGQLPSDGASTPFFGLPGNPGAAAACYRFLVVPYIRQLQGRSPEEPFAARIVNGKPASDPKEMRPVVSQRQARDFFRLGVVETTAAGENLVELRKEQSPAKLGPFIQANCWVHISEGSEARDGEDVRCYHISPDQP